MGLSFLAMGALLPQQGGFCWRRGYSARPYASARCPINTAVLLQSKSCLGPGVPQTSYSVLVFISLSMKFVAGRKNQVRLYR